MTSVKIASLLLGVLSCLASVSCEDKVWQTSLPDSRKLNTLAFAGTHESMSKAFVALFVSATQNMSITEQLEAGIRVFDLQVRRYSGYFAMHQGLIYLKRFFVDVLDDVEAFFRKHPKEFVIMQIKEDYTPSDTTESNCEVLEKYFKERPNLFSQSWSIGDTIGQHRGKILLAQRDGSGFQECSSKVLPLPCKEQRELELEFFSGKDKKWDHIKEFQLEVSSKTHRSPCYINYLPASDATNNWESVANSNNLGFIFGYTEGMNNKFMSVFKNPKNTLYIVMADFPYQVFIDLIVDSNE